MVTQYRWHTNAQQESPGVQELLRYTSVFGKYELFRRIRVSGTQENSSGICTEPEDGNTPHVHGPATETIGRPAFMNINWARRVDWPGGVAV